MFNKEDYNRKQKSLNVLFTEGHLDSWFIHEDAFSIDWDFLMDVVEKINERDWVTIMSKSCKIHSSQIENFETILFDDEESTFDAVIKAVVDYIDLNLEF